MKIGKLTLIESVDGYIWHCACECGNHSYPTKHNLFDGKSRSCGNCGKNYYSDCADGKKVEIISTNGVSFYIDKLDEELIRKYKWHVCTDKKGIQTVISSSKSILHRLLMAYPENYEVDHIDLNRLNNKRSNLRIVTHQQNQCNQPLQQNNSSGITGVSYYPPRNKFRARIKTCQYDIHLGYFDTFEDAVKARNIGMLCMFGQYGRYEQTDEGAEWIQNKVIKKCAQFAALAVSSAFFDFWEAGDGATE